MPSILNFRFGKKTTTENLLITTEKCEKLWRAHIKSYKKRREIATTFNYQNVKILLKDWNTVLKTLKQLENTIDEDIVSIKGEDTLEEKILLDLVELSSQQEKKHIERLTCTATGSFHGDVIKGMSKTEAVRELLLKTYTTLALELHTIKVIRALDADGRVGPNILTLFLGLFDLIKNEHDLYTPFEIESYYTDTRNRKRIHERILSEAHAILAGNAVEDAIASAEDEFVRELAAKMSEQGEKRYRELAVGIFEKLLETVGAPFQSEDFENRLATFDKLIKSKTQLTPIVASVIKKMKFNCKPNELSIIVQAFQLAHNFGHFEDLEGGFTH